MEGGKRTVVFFPLNCRLNPIKGDKERKMRKERGTVERSGKFTEVQGESIWEKSYSCDS